MTSWKQNISTILEIRDGRCIIFKFLLISTFYVTNAENRLKSFKHCGHAADWKSIFFDWKLLFCLQKSEGAPSTTILR